MLTTQSYATALLVWWLSASVGLVVLARWLPKGWPVAIRWGLIGLLAGLLMTPAAPQAQADTLAPALVVALFNAIVGEGWVSAVPAVARLLVAMTMAAALMSLLGAWWRRRQQAMGANH